MNLKRNIIIGTAFAMASAGFPLAGFSADQQGAEQTTEQPDAQPEVTLDQKMTAGQTWSIYYMRQAGKLAAYGDSLERWWTMYNTIAAPSIKRYGDKQAQEMAGLISKDMVTIRKESKTSWGKIGKAVDGINQPSDKLRKNPNEKDFETFMQKANELANVINTESESIFKNGQAVVKYHRQVTAALDGIIAKLKENPKTSEAGERIDGRWEREPAWLGVDVTEPIRLEPFDPAKPITPAKMTTQRNSSVKAGAYGIVKDKYKQK